MSKKKLQKIIQSKLTKLHELIKEIVEVQNINSDDPETWDSDTLYNLVENLKEALKILEDQPIKGKSNEFGQPLYEDGLCALVDEYQEESNLDD